MQTLHQPGSRVPCHVLAVGPRRCLVECYGYDINLSQRDMSYTAIPNLREQYHPGDELTCVVKQFDRKAGALEISVKETVPNPFNEASLRHPVGCRRRASIAGKYAGGVFCNLPDGAVVMCRYSFHYEDSDFKTGDTVMVVIQRYDEGEEADFREDRRTLKKYTKLPIVFTICIQAVVFHCIGIPPAPLDGELLMLAEGRNVF